MVAVAVAAAVAVVVAVVVGVAMGGNHSFARPTGPTYPSTLPLWRGSEHEGGLPTLAQTTNMRVSGNNWAAV